MKFFAQEVGQVVLDHDSIPSRSVVKGSFQTIDSDLFQRLVLSWAGLINDPNWKICNDIMANKATVLYILQLAYVVLNVAVG